MPTRPTHLTRPTALIAVLAATAGCFPTPTPARIDPGFRVDAAVVRIADQRRNREPQPADAVFLVGPAFGIGDRAEVGLPLGIYYEDGLGGRPGHEVPSRTPVLAPFVRMALLPTGSRTHLTAGVQFVALYPGNVTLRLGRELSGWEPYIGASWINSGGPAGDDPLVRRYQEAGQLLLAGHAGATFFVRGRPTFEVGILRNRYQEGAHHGAFGQRTERRVLRDAFFALRMSF